MRLGNVERLRQRKTKTMKELRNIVIIVLAVFMMATQSFWWVALLTLPLFLSVSRDDWKS